LDRDTYYFQEGVNFGRLLARSEILAFINNQEKLRDILMLNETNLIDGIPENIWLYERRKKKDKEFQDKIAARKKVRL
jgi:hypothetical protein